VSDEEFQKEPAVLFDTEVVVGKVGELEHGLQMFQRPCGQSFALSYPLDIKTWDDTNMMMAACLPQPYQFEAHGVFLCLRAEFPEEEKRLIESLRSATLTIEFGWHYVILKVAMCLLPRNPMNTIIRTRKGAHTWWELKPFTPKPFIIGGNLGLSCNMTANVKWEPEFKEILPPCRLRVALVGNLVMPQGYWEYLKQEEKQP